MKNTILVLCFIFFASCKEDAKVTQKQEVLKQSTTKAEPDKKKPLSPHTSAMAMVGDAHIHIDYSSPGVRKRIIFGGLLPYDEVWQAGAHNATWFETNKDLTIAGKKLNAGKYGFFVIPSQGEWTVIFNSHWEQHGKDEYDDKNDVLRFNVTPRISEDIQEHLEFKVTKASESSGQISMAWEKFTIEFPFEVL